MITASSVIARVRASLDAQPNTGYYNDTDDIIPAIDSAVKWVMSVINSAKAREKKVAEVLAALQFCRIYVTNAQSRIMIQDNVLTIDSVNPLPVTRSNGTPVPPPPASDFDSYIRTDLVFDYSNYSAARKTVEESGENRNNPFSPGYFPPNEDSSLLVDGSDLNIDFAYLDGQSYNTAQQATLATRGYIEIQPLLSKKNVAVFLTLSPGDVTTSASEIALPPSLFVMIVEKSLNFVSYVQGDKTTIWQVTEADIQKLIAAVT